MGRLGRYRTYLANGLLVHKLLKMLAAAGIVIEPYYFYQEPPPVAGAGSVVADVVGFEFCEAGAGDAEGIAGLDPSVDNRGEIRENFRNGKRCFALRHEGRIVTVSWCDVREISFEPCRRPLGRDEAYLYGMETLYAYRGRNLAPYLRSRCRETLAAEGRGVVYSYTDLFNAPAVRFKEKIGARPLYTGLSLKVWGLPGRNMILRRRHEVLRPPPPSVPPPVE